MNTCWGVPWGSPGTLCHCSHPIDFHIRQQFNTSGESICLMCLTQDVDELRRQVQAMLPPVPLPDAKTAAELACYHCGREFKDVDVRELHEAVFHEGGR